MWCGVVTPAGSRRAGLNGRRARGRDHGGARAGFKDATNQALAALESARDELTRRRGHAKADLSAVSAYIDKRWKRSGTRSLQTMRSARDKVQAAAQNDAYNVADAEAAALAEQLPSEPSSVVFYAYESATGELRNAYSTARSQAGTADAFIRDYLGAASK
ncbi:MAG: hypothetical protein ACLSVD_09765 [Eggerthellaceae bacterium]